MAPSMPAQTPLIAPCEEIVSHLLKDAKAGTLFEAVQVVAAGEALLAPSITRRLISGFARQGPAPPA